VQDERVSVLGFSAGGHLAATLGRTTTHAPTQDWIDLYSPWLERVAPA
jgi:acetyl esterase/lipase